jgi:hypothetical protein
MVNLNMEIEHGAADWYSTVADFVDPSGLGKGYVWATVYNGNVIKSGATNLHVIELGQYIPPTVLAPGGTAGKVLSWSNGTNLWITTSGTLPGDAAGMLTNNGSGTLGWMTIPGSAGDWALYSTNMPQSIANATSNSLYAISSNITVGYASAASNSLYTISSNIAVNFDLNASNALYTVSSNIAQAKANSASNSLYTTSSNISQSLANNASNSLYTVSSNISQSLANNASNSLYTVSSNISQALVNSGSNSLYTISSNISIAYSSGTANNVSNWVNAVSNLVATKQVGSAWLSNLSTNAVITNALQGAAICTNGPAILQSATNYANGTTNSTIVRQADLTAASNAVIVLSTNLATAAGQIISMAQDATVCITNAMAGNVNVLLTNIVDRKYFVARCLADGSARTVSFFTGGGTMNWISTNNLVGPGMTNFSVPANKIATVVGRAWLLGAVTNVDLFVNLQP